MVLYEGDEANMKVSHHEKGWTGACILPEFPGMGRTNASVSPAPGEESTKASEYCQTSESLWQGASWKLGTCEEPSYLNL